MIKNPVNRMVFKNGHRAKLTPKQERFVATYFILGNAAESYRRCYNCSQMKPASIHTCVKELLANPHITSRLKEYQANVETKIQESMEQHLSRLEIIRDRALSGKNFSIAVKAELLRGMALGFYSHTDHRNRRR